MISGMDGLFALVACAAMSLFACLALQLSRSRHAVRIRQLEEATALLNAHATCLDRLLVDPVVPDALKDRMVRFGDSIADRAAVGRMATWLANRPFGVPVDSESAHELAALVDGLTRDHSESADHFVTAVVTGTFGACLRWPETAALFEQMTSKMAATPGRDVAVAATISSLSDPLPSAGANLASAPA